MFVLQVGMLQSQFQELEGVHKKEVAELENFYNLQSGHIEGERFREPGVRELQQMSQSPWIHQTINR